MTCLSRRPVAGLVPATDVFLYCPQLVAQKAWVAGPRPARGGVCYLHTCGKFGRK